MPKFDTGQCRFINRKIIGAQSSWYTFEQLNLSKQVVSVSYESYGLLAEIWSLIVLYSQYLPGVDCALEFLNSQGRMKFTRPIYKALMAWPTIRQQAINNFKSHRPFLHPTTAKLVEKDIGLC
uniref:Leuk-A4-hydro_C domain-containing protein n=1 Tax=Mesocestoides corti TaxID=53468 RepID=A0A5K3FPV0_MESCO